MYPWDDWCPGYPERYTEARMPMGGRRRPWPNGRARYVFAPEPAGLELGKGTLRIRVLSDATGEPMSGATITVYGAGGESGTKEYYTVQSDEYGFSPKMPLPAPAQKYSQQAGGVVTPYFTYNVTVSKNGYHTQVYRAIQIFADTECMHDAKMKLLPRGAQSKPEVVYEEPPHSLRK